MLTRLYVDNFKCLVNFEYAPTPVQLLVGSNGTGKSTVLDVLRRIQDWASGAANEASTAFGSNTLTRWQHRRIQTLEVDVARGPARYHYALEIEHDQRYKPNRVRREALDLDGTHLFLFEEGEVQLYRDDGSQGPAFGFDWTRSGLAAVASRTDNTHLTWFRDWLRSAMIVAPNPLSMEGSFRDVATKLQPDAANFAAWFMNLSLERPEVAEPFKSDLPGLLDGFRYAKFDKVGLEEWRLVFDLVIKPNGDSAGQPSGYAFDELSDGQRQLLFLHCLASYLAATPGALVCLDEPDNYVSLSEVQPVMQTICREAVVTGNRQVLIASHHPELVSLLAPEQAVVLTRPDGAHTRLRPFPTDVGEGLTAAEILARGWEQ